MRNRRNIQNSDNIKDGDLWKSISFLVEQYTPQLWYWEIIETLRKLTLSAFISVVYPDSVSQIVISIVLSLLIYKLYFEVKPFESEEDNSLMNLGNYFTLLTFVYAYVKKDNTLGDNTTMESIADSTFTFISVVFIGANVYILLANFRKNNKKESDSPANFKNGNSVTNMTKYYNSAPRLTDFKHFNHFHRYVLMRNDSRQSAISFLLCQELLKRYRRVSKYNEWNIRKPSSMQFYFNSGDMPEMEMKRGKAYLPVTTALSENFVYITPQGSRLALRIDSKQNNSKSKCSSSTESSDDS